MLAWSARALHERMPAGKAARVAVSSHQGIPDIVTCNMLLC